MHRLDRIISADWQRGVIRAEAGLSLDALLRLAVPKGWFLPVTPGTKFVTLGGAVANDVHGKNHEAAGTFGCHVRGLGLLRSTGEVLDIGPDRNPEMFAATVGGLGLTGLVLWVELQLEPIRSAWFDSETSQVAQHRRFLRPGRGEPQIGPIQSPGSIAWQAGLRSAAGCSRGRVTPKRAIFPCTASAASRGCPLDAPGTLLSSPVVRAFNLVYAGRPGVEGKRRVHYDPFLYPLDSIEGWNRLYGRPGFFQHQSVVPLDAAPDALKKLLELTSAHRQGSFLVVLKLFGNRPSPGLMSFPMEGATFALDLPNRGAGDARRCSPAWRTW